MSATITSQARPLASREHERFDVIAVGAALSVFFLITYGIIAVAYLLDPHMPMTQALIHEFIPGTQAPPPGELLEGAIFAFAWGWYIALVGVPLYNVFLARRRSTRG
ncbi:hypothetical protein DWG18_01310 [Lysobacter sp. TY2-98]|uniref:hypothetical protein n=1 Tax=Lysobacter sp. TY2-98 TaxID=2290922 RepID=UPI000E1FEA78|nr:hypothetical protein [Lysobacter sp. TY2-98]AXK71058.1 hypothetical protein DWG18_01310 [Lysobacter sp. TY2-98]